MGVGILIGYILGLILLILSPVAYFSLKKNGHKKAGIVIALFLALIVIIPAFFMIFESELYWKSDAINDLNEIEITLTDDFEILRNEIVGSMDYYQTTELLISASDRDKIIKKIENADNYKSMDSKNSLADEMKRQLSEKVIWNYKFNDLFVRESYEKEAGYVPIEIAVVLRRESDTLRLSKIMD